MAMKKITSTILENSMIGIFVQKGVPASCGARMFNKTADTFTFGKGFFYSNGMTAETFAAKVLLDLRTSGYTVERLDCGQHGAPFHGGADRFQSKNSFFWVVCNVTKNA